MQFSGTDMHHIVITKILPSAHKGDLAIAKAMLDTIKMMHPEWSLSLFCRNPVEDKQIFEKYGSVNGEVLSNSTDGSSKLAIVRRFCRYMAWRIISFPRLDDRADRFVNACKSADALLFCGGGSPGGYGFVNLILHALVPVILAKKTHIPIIFSAIGIEPITSPVHRTVMRWILNQVDLIAVRDPQARETLNQIDVKARIELTADWAIGLQPAGKKECTKLLYESGVKERHVTRIGMNLRDVAASGPEGQTRENSDYEAFVKSAISMILDRMAADIVVVSMTCSSRTDDLAFAQKIKAGLNEAHKERFHILQDDYSPEQIKGIISLMDIFIATRLHPAIFAVSEAVPTIAVHNFFKVKGFMQYTGLEKWFLPIDRIAAEDVAVAAEKLVLVRQNISEQINDKLIELNKAVSRNVELIEEIVPNRISEF